MTHARKNASIIFALILLCSCSGKELNSIKPDQPGLIKLAKLEAARVTIDLKGTAQMTPAIFNANEFVISSGNNRVVYPGSIIKGESLTNFSLNGLYGYSKPIRVSATIPNTTNRILKNISAPSPTSTIQLVRDLLRNELSGTGSSTQYTYDVQPFSNYAEVNRFYGYAANASNFGTNTITKATGVMIKFVIRNFTLNVEIPASGELIDRNIDPTVLNGHVPLYVNSVTYGRMGIVTFETNENQQIASTLLNKIFTSPGTFTAGSLTATEKRILDEGNIKMSLNGVNISNGFPGNLPDLIQSISQGLTYTPDSPGVPVLFKMRYTSDNSDVIVPFVMQ